MKKQINDSYEEPTVRVIEVKVENGFALSGGEQLERGTWVDFGEGN